MPPSDERPSTASKAAGRIIRPGRPDSAAQRPPQDSYQPRPTSSGHLTRPRSFRQGDRSDRSQTGEQEQAQLLGIDPSKEKNLMWVAAEASIELLPAGWTEHKTADNVIYYYHEASDESTFESPLEGKYRAILTTLRKLEGIRMAREQGSLTNTTGSATSGQNSKKKRSSIASTQPKSDADIYLPRDIGPMRMSDVTGMALYMGVDLKKEPFLARIIRDCVLAGLPQEWLEFRDTDGEAYFYNRESGVSGREHPGDPFFKQELARERSRPHPPDETYWVELRTPRNLKYSHDFATDVSRFDPSDEVARKSSTAIAAVYKAGKARTLRRVTKDFRGRHNSTLIQCAFRMHRARKQYRALLKASPRHAAAVKITAVMRRHRARILAKVARAAKKAAEEEAARVLAEAALAQKLYLEQLAERKKKEDAAAVPIQAACRRRIARKRLRVLRTGLRDEAHPICSAIVAECVDGAVWQVENKAKDFADAAERKAEEQRRAMLVYGAARTIQAVYRRRLAVVERRDAREEQRISKLERAKTAANNRRAAASVVRAAWLAAMAREERRRLVKDKAAREERGGRFKAATKIQAVQRRHMARAERAQLRYRHLGTCASRMQAVVRRRFARKRLARHRQALLDVVRADGARIAKVVKLQAVVRSRLAGNRLRRHRKDTEKARPEGAAIVLQTAWRGYAARSALRRFRISVGAVTMQAAARSIQGAWGEWREARDRRYAEERAAATRALAEASMYTVVDDPRAAAGAGGSKPGSRGPSKPPSPQGGVVVVSGLPRDRSSGALRRQSSSLSNKAAEESVERLLDERHLTGVMGVRELASVVNSHSQPTSPEGSPDASLRDGRVQGVLARNAWNTGSQSQLAPLLAEARKEVAAASSGGRKSGGGAHTETGEGVSTVTYYLNNSNGRTSPIFLEDDEFHRGSPPRLLSVNNGPGDILVRTADVDYPFRSDFVFSTSPKRERGRPHPWHPPGYQPPPIANSFDWELFSEEYPGNGYGGASMFYGYAPVAAKRGTKAPRQRPPPRDTVVPPAGPPRVRRPVKDPLPKSNSKGSSGAPAALLPALPGKGPRQPVGNPHVQSSFPVPTAVP